MVQRIRGSRRLVFGFIAGFLAVWIFHQGTLAILYVAHLTTHAPFSIAPTAPFGVPQVLSLAFWGGLWGIVFAAIAPSFRWMNSWLLALCFGAIAPSLVAWFIVAPLKGQPIAAGGNATGILTALLINGAWGIGTALFLKRLV